MKKTLLTLATLLFAITLGFNAHAQNAGVTQTTQLASNNPQITGDSIAIFNVYDRIHIRNKKPIPYVPIREADVMWSKDVWRTIDLREKMNQPLYFPEKPTGQRMNFFSLILHGMTENNLHAYQDDPNNMFTTELLMTYDEVIEKLGADTVFGQVIPRSHQVKQLLVKEKWFFDKQHSTMRVRIQGVAPIRVFNETVTDASGNTITLPEVSRVILCWIYFPEYRDLFAQYEIYNPRNDSQPTSFDDLFIQRRFSSFISKESNVFNRALADYLTGDDILHESEKVKMKLFEFEHDLWEY
ncbi:MAG: gliding motility protein GldN [Bacteroidales bacterium]|nr:gliding motility protein GldN [Bacteroidales bacterium]MCF8389212.1 gliding motility protein GldN [Bacteroidales bacterium]